MCQVSQTKRVTQSLTLLGLIAATILPNTFAFITSPASRRLLPQLHSFFQPRLPLSHSIGRVLLWIRLFTNPSLTRRFGRGMFSQNCCVFLLHRHWHVALIVNIYFTISIDRQAPRCNVLWCGVAKCFNIIS